MTSSDATANGHGANGANGQEANGLANGVGDVRPGWAASMIRQVPLCAWWPPLTHRAPSNDLQVVLTIQKVTAEHKPALTSSKYATSMKRSQTHASLLRSIEPKNRIHVKVDGVCAWVPTLVVPGGAGGGAGGPLAAVTGAFSRCTPGGGAQGRARNVGRGVGTLWPTVVASCSPLSQTLTTAAPREPPQRARAPTRRPQPRPRRPPRSARCSST
jgi:hypothetical protein